MEPMADAITEAEKLIASHEEGRRADAGFDGGEFSGPAHDNALERGLTEIASRHSVSIIELEQHLAR